MKWCQHTYHRINQYQLLETSHACQEDMDLVWLSSLLWLTPSLTMQMIGLYLLAVQSPYFNSLHSLSPANIFLSLPCLYFFPPCFLLDCKSHYSGSCIATGSLLSLQQDTLLGSQSLQQGRLTRFSFFLCLAFSTIFSKLQKKFCVSNLENHSFLVGLCTPLKVQMETFHITTLSRIILNL